MTRDEIIIKSAELGAEAVFAVECGKEDPSVIPFGDGHSVAPFIAILTQSVNPVNPYRQITISDKALNDTGGNVIYLTTEEEIRHQELMQQKLKELHDQAHA